LIIFCEANYRQFTWPRGPSVASKDWTKFVFIARVYDATTGYKLLCAVDHVTVGLMHTAN